MSAHDPSPAKPAERLVNMHEAKTHLSRLVQEAVEGKSFVIAKAGKPMVRVEAVEPKLVDPSRRIGFAKDEDWKIPKDFDRFMEEEIRVMFEDGPLFPEGYDEFGNEIGDDEQTTRS